MARIQSTPKAIHRALEVGPGAGGYLPILAKVAQELVAADIEDAYLSQARILAETAPELSCVKDDITATTLEPDSYDLVLCRGH